MELAAHLAARREAVAGAATALQELRAVLHQCPNGELGRFAGELAELRALAGAGLVATVAEAVSRGVVTESQYASTRSWVADAAWHSRQESATIAKAADVLVRDDLMPIADAVAETDIDPATAVVIASEYDGLAPDLAPDAAPAVLEQFIDIAEHGPRAVRQLKEHLLARYGEQGEFDEQQERCRRQIHLSSGRQNEAGLWDYRLTVDNEGYAVLEAAIGPGSAPAPNPDTGERDPRPGPRRRGEALISALRRSVTAAGRVPTAPKATLMVTMSYADLASQIQGSAAPGGRMVRGTHRGAAAGPGTAARSAASADDQIVAGGRYRLNAVDSADMGAAGAGQVLASLAGGTLLAPDTVRKIACDAAIIPAVLGSSGEILDRGRTQRLFTPGQVRALWLRDMHCTFDACDIPAAWCDAHHLIHWFHGGATSMDNAALLCPRHHSIVHRDMLAGQVTPSGVTWDRRPDSYRVPTAATRSSDHPPPSEPLTGRRIIRV